MTRLFNGLRAILSILTGLTAFSSFFLTIGLTLIIAIGNANHPSGMGPDVGVLERMVIFVPLCGGGTFTLFLGVLTYLFWPWKYSVGHISTHLAQELNRPELANLMVFYLRSADGTNATHLDIRYPHPLVETVEIDTAPLGDNGIIPGPPPTTRAST